MSVPINQAVVLNEVEKQITRNVDIQTQLLNYMTDMLWV